MTDIAVFDFDRTLSRGDSLLRLLSWHFSPKRLVSGCISLAPVLGGYGIGLVSNGRAKEAVLAEFFRGWTCSALNDLCGRYATEVVPKHLVEPGLARVNWHRDRGHILILASASLTLYLEPWGRSAGFDSVVATRLEYCDGRATGRIDGLNCYGPEKLRRVYEAVATRDAKQIWVYGDGRGDLELAQAAQMVGWRSFDAIPVNRWRGPRD